MLELFHSLARNGNHVEIWTAAREDNRELTQKWLHDKCGIARKHLTHMRPVGDRRKTSILKEAWILSAPLKPAIFFDDHTGVVDMVRSHGIIGCCVGNNNY